LNIEDQIELDTDRKLELTVSGKITAVAIVTVVRVLQVAR